MGQPNPEICSIRIVFPVVSDEQAIEYKKKIREVLAETPDVQINFSIMNLPKVPNDKLVQDIH